MKNKHHFSPPVASALLAGAALLAVLSLGVTRSPADEAHVSVNINAGVAIQDEYDYYPAYETYYNRSRHEYYYREGKEWVHRREAPNGVKAEVLLRAPSVRMDFHDAPDRHHDVVVKSYPRNWKPEEHREERHEDRRSDRAVISDSSF